MEKNRDKIYYRKDNHHHPHHNNHHRHHQTTQCKSEVFNKKETKQQQQQQQQRPRSRSVYTNKSHVSDGSGSLRDLKQYENGNGNNNSPWIPRILSNKSLYLDDYTHDLWHEDASIGGASITPHGVITLRLHDRVRVDISLDRAIRVVNMRSGIVLALSATGSCAALIHPNGRVYQYGSRVEILANDAQGNNKYAKMWYKGVSFTSDQCALVYLVDSAGTRTTTDTFSDLSGDFSLSVFYSDSQYGDATSPSTTSATTTTTASSTNTTPSSKPATSSTSATNNAPNTITEAIALLQTSNFWMTDDGTDNWIINNVRISQTSDGLVRVGRNSNKFSLRTSPSNGSASVSSPFLHCTGSMGQTRHLFVRRGERRMHYDGVSFIVRNAGHSAGFDDKHQLKVY